MRVDPEIYQKAKVAAEAIKKELEPLILGKKLEPWGCNCGAIGHGMSTAIAVRPAGMDPRYEDQIGLWDMWSVNMRDDDNTELAANDYSYSTGLSSFVDSSVLREMFIRHFGDIGVSVSRR